MKNTENHLAKWSFMEYDIQSLSVILYEWFLPTNTNTLLFMKKVNVTRLKEDVILIPDKFSANQAFRYQ